MIPIRIEKTTKLIAFILSIIIFFYIIKMTIGYIYPFIIAILLTVLLKPVVSLGEKHLKLNRGLAVFSVMMTVFCSLVIFLFIFTDMIITGLITLTNKLPQNISYMNTVLLEKGQALYEELLVVFPFFEKLALTEYFNQFMEKGSSMIIDFLTQLLWTATNAVSSLPHFFIISLFILIAVYMLLKDYHLIHQTTQKIIPNKVKRHFHPVILYAKQSFIGLLRAQFIMTSISSIIIGICLYFFQLEHYITLTVIMFIVDFIPYIGLGVIFIPWILFVFITGQYVLTIELAALYGILLILRQMMEPKIIAREIGIHPFIALSILFLSYQTIGLLGILLTPVILIFISAVHKANLFTAMYDYIYTNRTD